MENISVIPSSLKVQKLSLELFRAFMRTQLKSYSSKKVLLTCVLNLQKILIYISRPVTLKMNPFTYTFKGF